MTSANLLRSAAAAGVLVLGLAACGGDDDPTVAGTVPGATGAITDKIEVKDFSFKPAEASVKAGTTVTWNFADDAAHNVEPVDPSSELKTSPDLRSGGVYTFTPTRAGTIAYRCGIHNSMTGTVVVTA